MAALDDLVKVARETVKVREGDPDRWRRKTQAIRAYADEHPGLSRKQLTEAIHEDLRRNKFTDEQIDLLGMSLGSVNKALERRWLD